MTSLEQALNDQLLKAASIMEEQVDREMEKLSNLDEDDLEAIRRKRFEALKKKQEQKKEWLTNGHGGYEELPDEKSFFDATKKSKKVVCHFYLSSVERCKILDMHLQLIAPKHIGTRFVRANADKFPFLMQRLNIRVIPTIAIVMDSITVDYIRGFGDLGGIDDFKTETLEWRLAQGGAVDYDGPSCLGASGVVKKIAKGPKRAIRGKIEDDSDEDW